MFSLKHLTWLFLIKIFKLLEIIKSTENLLNDVSGYKKLSSYVQNLLGEMRKTKNDYYQDWCDNTLSNIDDPQSNISLQTNGKLMELDHKNGKLNVLYGDKLITLLREVRQLESLGFKIPNKIEQCATVGQKFYKHGIILKQLANFYNKIDKEMLPCQQAMMLESALEFERIIKNQKVNKDHNGITWDNPQDLERYIGQLQTSAEKLSSENRKLRKLHQRVCDLTVNLINIDLLRQQQKWKDNVIEIRKTINEALQMGFNEKGLKPWQAHWDRQLYKVLEYQYRFGLDTLNENMPEIKVELIFKGKIQFRPPLEEIKAKYFREMKQFMSFPNRFKGVNETNKNLIFQTIVERNSEGLTECFYRSQELFKALVSVYDIFTVG